MTLFCGDLQIYFLGHGKISKQPFSHRSDVVLRISSLSMFIPLFFVICAEFIHPNIPGAGQISEPSHQRF